MPEQSWRGKHKLKSLRERGGRSALATVLGFDERWGVPESGYGGIPLGRSEHYTLKIRVEPVGEPAFEAEIKEHDFFVADSGQLQKLRASGELNEEQNQQKRAQLAAEFGPEAPVAGPAARDTAAQLTDLAALHDRGVLSDAEFEPLGGDSTAAQLSAGVSCSSTSNDHSSLAVPTGPS